MIVLALQYVCVCVCICVCTLKHTYVHTSHNHLQSLFQSDLDGFKRLNFAAYDVEVYFHNYTLQGYSCTLWVWTYDLGCIMEQFMISFFFPLVHDKHLQTSSELTTMTTYSKGVWKSEIAEISPFFLSTSVVPSLSSYPSLLHFHVFLQSVEVEGERGCRSCCTSEVYLASPWGVRWGSASQGNCQRFLVGLAHSQTHSHTYTHAHAHQLAWVLCSACHGGKVYPLF